MCVSIASEIFGFVCLIMSLFLNLFLKDIFAGYTVLGFFFPSSILKRSLHFLLVCMVSDEKSDENDIFVLLYVMCLFFNFLLSRVFLCLLFFSHLFQLFLAGMSRCLCVCGMCGVGVGGQVGKKDLSCLIHSELLGFLVSCLSSVLDSLSHYFFKYFFCPFPLLSFSYYRIILQQPVSEMTPVIPASQYYCPVQSPPALYLGWLYQGHTITLR